MFEKTVRSMTFGSKRAEVRGDWRKMYNEELSDMYCSSNIFRVKKQKWMRLAWHVVGMGVKTNA